MQVFHGKIITCDDKNTVANYLVEREGRIAYIGDELPEQYGIVPPIELGKNVVIPAFVDSHMHYSGFSVLHKLFPINDTESNAKILESLKEYADNSRENIIVGFGASEYAVTEGHLLLREQLDNICPDKPMCVIKHDAHSGVVNTAFIEQIKGKACTLRGYNELTGEMSQEAFMVVSELISKGLSTRRVIESMVESADFFASKGIGMINSSSGLGFIRDYDFDMEKSVAKGLDNGMQVRVSYQTSDFLRSSKKDMSRVVFANLDGNFSSLDASLLDDYNVVTNKGVSYFNDQDVEKFCIEANRAGYQIALHAVGDAAFDQATRALATALEDYPRYNHRHMILYATLPTVSGLRTCAKYGIMLAVQPNGITHIDGTIEFFNKIIGKERVSKINPLLTASEMGVKICFCSGAPQIDPNPIEWIAAACNNPTSEESISVTDALRMATFYGAYSSFDENERGTLEIGKSCDLAVLDEDIYSVDVSEIKNINVAELYLKGKAYERSRTGAMATMLRGMFPQN
ncbi:MAG: amidohydrolase family protein [Pseudobutyrivibrio sp.]|nr:amidohydrolase family protein [Pseudobutyrivibrio sp.]